MRTWIQQLERAGELATVNDRVDVEFDIGQYLFKEKEKALLFDNVANHPGWKVLGQAPANWRQIGLAFDTEPDNIVREFARRVDTGLVSCRTVASGPVKEVVLKGKEVNLLNIPIHQIAEKDPAPFIASALNIIKDPETGIRNVAMHRHQLKGKNKLGIMMVAGKHTQMIYQK